MARVRLYGPARDAFGAATLEVPASDVDELVAALGRAGAPAAVALLSRCRVWVNGDPAPPGLALAAADEVAIVPPVSGGAT